MLEKIGQSVRQQIINFTYMLGYVGKLLIASILFATRGKASRKTLTMQLLFTYVEALPITSILAVGIGSAIILLGNSFLTSIGQAKLTYTLLVLVVMRELGPILIAFVVTARSATAIATEISTNVVNHEIEAYISVGMDPVLHLAAPRFLGVVLSTFFLNLYFSIFGLIAPAIVIQLISATNISEYFNNLFQAISLKIILISILKSIIFGMIVSISATYYGFNVGIASTEIPLAGLRAVSKAFILIILADAFITALSYLF